MSSNIEIIKGIFRKNTKRHFIKDITCSKENNFSYGDIYDQAVAFSSWLSRNGIKKGDRVSVSIDNSYHLAVIYFAFMFSGVVVVPINPTSSLKQLLFIIKSSNSVLHIISDDLEDKQGSLNKEIELIRIMKTGKNGYVNNNDFSYINLDELEKHNFAPFKDCNDDDDLMIIYTSGTTADPKGVIHKRSSLIRNGVSFINELNIDSRSRFINLLPMTYLGGYYNLLFIPFLGGASIVLSKPFNARMSISFWNTIIKHNVNTVWLVPSILSMVLSADRNNKSTVYCNENSLKILVGTAPLTVSLRKKFEKKYKVKILENYGLSETLFISTNKAEFETDKSGVGKLLPHVEIKIDNNIKDTYRISEEGEILVRSPYLFTGYNSFENSFLENGWFRTGDIGYLTEDKYLHITGRKKDIIIRGGINISPVSIENILYKHPAVAECAVVGLPDEVRGEKIIATIKCKDYYSFDECLDEIKKLCKENLSPIQLPEEFQELSDFPYSSSGKILKRKIRAWAIDRNQKEKLQSDNNIIKKSQNIERKVDFFEPSEVVDNSIEAMSVKYNCKVYEMKGKGIDVITLSLGEAFFDIPLYPFDDLPLDKIYHYSHSRGILELREKIAEYFKNQYEFHFDPEKEIIITAGSKIAIYMSLMSVINPGDHVLVYEPAWVSYPEQIKLCYGVPVRIPYYEDIFNFEKYITNRTRVIIINNPNNPTGKIYSIEELIHLNNLAKKYNLYVLSDEAYSDFIADNDKFISLGNLDKKKEHSIIINSISKNYGISGWRLGYVITNEKLTNQILKVNQHLITCPATILEYYIAKHFNDIIKITKSQIFDVVEKRENLCNYLDKIGLTHLPGVATFYIFMSIAPSRLTSEEFCDILLDKEHICVVPGIGYGKSCDKFVRVAVGTESIKRTCYAFDKMKELIKKTK